MIDGEIARSSGKVSTYGEFLDATIDRISDTLYITSFGFAGLVRWEIICILLACSFMVSYLRAKAELASSMVGRFSKFDVGILERPERILGLIIFQISFLLFPSFLTDGYKLNVLEVGFLIITGLSVVSIVQRFMEANKRLNKEIDKGLNVDELIGGDVLLLRKRVIETVTVSLQRMNTDLIIKKTSRKSLRKRKL
jgi:phosphatidylglycerophosphate synthase